MRSKDRNEADAIKDPSEVGRIIPHPVESGEALGTGSNPTPRTIAPLNLKKHVASGMRMTVFRVIYLTVLPRNADNVVSDPTPSATRKATRPKPWDRILNRSTGTSEDKSESSFGSIAHAPAKVVVDVVKESSDVFPPLKALAGGLIAVLKHYDVGPVSLSPSRMLIIAPASGGQSENNRVFDPPA